MHLANHVKRTHDKGIADDTLVDVENQLNQENTFITEAANKECVNEFVADTTSVWNPEEEQDPAATTTNASQVPASGQKSEESPINGMPATILPGLASTCPTLQFHGEIQNQSSFNQRLLTTSDQEFEEFEDIALGSNSVIMGLSTRLDQLQDNLDLSMAETLETDIPPLIASTQADPASRQQDPLVPTVDINQLQMQLINGGSSSPTKATSLTQTIFQEKSSETCAVCGLSCPSVNLLQEHLLSEHCHQQSEITRSLNYLLQQLSSITANQSAQRIQMNNFEEQQKITHSEVSEIRKAIFSPKNQPPTLPSVSSEPCLTSASSPQGLTWANRASNPPGPATPRPRQANDLMLLVGDSIGHNLHLNEIENVTEMKIVTKKAYCTMSGGNFPESNYERVVPEILRSHPEAKILTFNASASDLTNISPGASLRYSEQQASTSSYNAIKIASEALKSNHPNLKKVIVSQRTPRYDNLNQLNEFANNELHKAWETLPENIRGKVVIGHHKLDCKEAIHVSRYGAAGTGVGGKLVDGLHMRGSSGKIAYTRSMANIMIQAGICSPAQVEHVLKNREIRMKKKNHQQVARQT